MKFRKDNVTYEFVRNSNGYYVYEIVDVENWGQSCCGNWEPEVYAQRIINEIKAKGFREI